MFSVADSDECKLDEGTRDLVRSLMPANIDNKERFSEELCVQLKRLQCPFTWKPYNDSNCIDVVSKVEEKLQQAEQEEEEWSAWTTFVLQLILCYEYGKADAVEFALEKQEECEKIADEITASGCTVPIQGVGLKHVSLACKVSLLIKSNSFEEAMKHLECITDIEDMANRDQATIWSVRGAVLLEYGLKGMKESVPFIEKALELDAECAEWHFLLGKSLSRVRRIEDRSSIPCEREIKAFEAAVNLSNDAFYMALLGQTYMDTARLVYWSKDEGKRRDWESFCNAMNVKSVEMYRKAMENCKENPCTLSRIASGFMRLPRPWKDMDSAETCIFKGLNIDQTNNSINLLAGHFYRNQNNFDKAIHHFNRSAEGGSFASCLELIVTKYRKSKSYSPVADFKKYVGRFKEKPLQETLLGLLGTFHYIVKKDFNAALNIWLQIIEKDISSSRLELLFCHWSDSPYRFNINKTIISEIIRRLDDNTGSDDDRRKYENILLKYKEKHACLVKLVEEEYA